eukprot:scaffold24260_cov126-Isochrysis_galbana.AAC.9
MPGCLPTAGAVYRLASDVSLSIKGASANGSRAAKNRPITAIDVQNDGRPLALPRDSRCAHRLRAAMAAA